MGLNAIILLLYLSCTSVFISDKYYNHQLNTFTDDSVRFEISKDSIYFVLHGKEYNHKAIVQNKNNNIIVVFFKNDKGSSLELIIYKRKKLIELYSIKYYQHSSSFTSREKIIYYTFIVNEIEKDCLSFKK